MIMILQENEKVKLKVDQPKEKDGVTYLGKYLKKINFT
ncbi:hypothetical protein AB32_1038 [Escherichia coli 2-316-03_S1_C2]|nr:hypothetical protein AC12_1034 [Escherichia coli 2-005-03_S3_C2]KEJ30662.1 hypothetical protein AB03_1098 [Escherichia coli 2-316-03_S1_C1]KEJ31880.1 hypothetical protein AB32_1038 [Escherichia coli 2-316-03_S1_C2]